MTTTLHHHEVAETAPRWVQFLSQTSDPRSRGEGLDDARKVRAQAAGPAESRTVRTVSVRDRRADRRAPPPKRRPGSRPLGSARLPPHHCSRSSISVPFPKEQITGRRCGPDPDHRHPPRSLPERARSRPAAPHDGAGKAAGRRGRPRSGPIGPFAARERASFRKSACSAVMKEIRRPALHCRPPFAHAAMRCFAEAPYFSPTSPFTDPISSIGRRSLGPPSQRRDRPLEQRPNQSPGQQRSATAPRTPQVRRRVPELRSSNLCIDQGGKFQQRVLQPVEPGLYRRKPLVDSGLRLPRPLLRPARPLRLAAR